jgi:hypothetical protein
MELHLQVCALKDKRYLYLSLHIPGQSLSVDVMSLNVEWRDPKMV